MTLSLTSYAIAPQSSIISKVNSVCLPNDKPLPQGLFTALYGARDTLTVIQEILKTTSQTGLLIHYAELKVKVSAGEDKALIVDSNTAEKAIMINLTKLDSDFEALLIKKVAPEFSGSSLATIIDENPNVLHKLFDCQCMPALNVVIWPVTYKEGEEKVQVATVKNLSEIHVCRTSGSFTRNPKIHSNKEVHLRLVENKSNNSDDEEDDFSPRM